MAYDYSELTGDIIKKFGTGGNFAKAMGLSERSVSVKLNNKKHWKQNEMKKTDNCDCCISLKTEQYLHKYWHNIAVISMSINALLIVAAITTMVLSNL